MINETRSMGRLSQRFWGAIGGRILDSGALDAVLAVPGQRAESAARLSEYERRWAYYANDRLYERLYRAGYVTRDVPTEFNPVPGVVGFYKANVLGGVMEVQPADGAADGDALRRAVDLVWEWSNFQTLRGAFVEAAAVFSDAFLKVAEKRNDDVTTAVYMQDISPLSVAWWEADERGFLTAIRIDTPRLTSVFSGVERRHTLVEVWRKDWGDGVGGVAWYEIAPGQMLDDTRIDNAAVFQTFDELGYDFIPIVWARVETHWRRQTDGIDLYNLKAWTFDRMNAPRWVVNSNTLDSRGVPQPAPRFVGAQTTGLAVQTADSEDGTATVIYMPGMSDLTAAPSPADLTAQAARLDRLRDNIVDALPEYRVSTLRATTQIATETLELLMAQAKQRVLDMRSDLERALVRAQMMALSIAQVAAVDEAIFGEGVIGTYADGRTDHVFAPRGVFEKSAAARAAELGQLTAAGASLEGAAKVAEYNDAQIEELVNGTTIESFPTR